MRNQLQHIRYIFTSLILMLMCQQLSAQVYLLNEDFSSASINKPPSGWSNLTVTGPATDEWRFDNPGNRVAAFPVVGQFAIFDSENYSVNNGAEKVSLETPFVDCSFSPVILLYFDHDFKAEQGGRAEIEVFNGTNWVVVKTFSESTVGTTKEALDLSAHLGRRTNAKIRFTWNGNSSRYWIIDNIKLFAPLSRDAAVRQLDVPTIPLQSGVSPIAITLANEGYETITSATLKWTANGISQPDYNWTGNIIRDSVQSNITIGNYNFPPGSITKLKIWVDNPNGFNDLNKLNDTLIIDLYTALCGTYTIGGNNPDFVSFSDAAKALNSAGVSCPVIFKVRSGVYDEQLRLFKVPGASSINTVTFESETGVNTSVELSYKAANTTNDYSLKLSGASHIFFKGISILRFNGYFAVNIDDQSSNIGFQNNYLHSVIVKNAKGISFTGNRLNTTIWWLSSISFYSTVGLNIADNFFNSSISIYSAGSRSDSVFIRGNNFLSPDSLGYGVAITIDDALKGVLDISNNIIKDYTLFGIKVRVLDTSRITIKDNKLDKIQDVAISVDGWPSNIIGNRITRMRNGIGIQVVSGASKLINNYIHASGLGQAKGIVLMPTANAVNVLHNSINIQSTDQINGRALEINGGVGHVVKNNIFSNPGGGFGFYLPVDPVTFDISHNVYFSSKSRVGFFNNKVYDTLTNFITATGQGAGSIYVNPYFESDTALVPTQALLDGSAIFISDTLRDISGVLRSIPSDMGAKEFDLCKNDASINGFVGLGNPASVGQLPIKVTLQNNGTDPLNSVIIKWSVNGVLQPEFIWSGSIQSKNSLEVLIGSFNFLSGKTYKFKAWTDMPNGQADCKQTNDTCAVLDLGTQLCGTYTIGGQNPDFLNFTDAAFALNNAGVTCPVIFKVRDGVYEEQIMLFNIPGSSSINTVTFESENRDSTRVQLHYKIPNGTNDYALKFNGSSNVRFNNIGILRTNGLYSIDFDNNSRNIEVKNGELKSVTIQNSKDIHLIKNKLSTNFHFVYGVEIWGAKNIFLDGNDISAQLAVRVNKLVSDSIYIKRNILTWVPHPYESGGIIIDGSIKDVLEIDSNTVRHYFTGMYLNIPSSIRARVRYNTVDSVRDAGIVLIGDTASLIGNKIIRVNAGVGIQVNSNRALIANNYIQTQGSGTSKGIVIQGVASQSKILFNNINVTGTDLVNGRAIEVSNSFNHIIRNNIFNNKGGGYAAYFGADVSNFTISHNNYYSSRSKIGYYQSKDYDTLSNFISDTKQGVGSLNVNPYFVSNTNLLPTHALLNASGVNLGEMAMDINGAQRGSPPDIGAIEFDLCPNDAGINSFTSLSNPVPAGLVPVKVVLQNNGSNPLTSTAINWSVNGILQPVFQWSGSLSVKEAVIVEIGTYNFGQSGLFKLRSWTTGANGQTDCKLANDTSEVLNLGAQLCGTYTIGGSNPDFVNFNDATLVLNSAGVGCPVVFKVRDGVYEEQVRIFNIRGASSINTITFESESADSLKAELHYKEVNLTSDFALKFSGASHVKFNQLSILRTNGGRSIAIDEWSKDITIKNSVFNPIAIDKSNEINISNNYLKSFDGWAILLSESKNVNINKNKIDNAHHGINIIGPQSDSIYIKSNVIEARVRYRDAYGITTGGNIKDILEIDSNTISNFIDYAISVYSPNLTRTKIRSNLIYNIRDAGVIINGQSIEVVNNRILHIQAGIGIIGLSINSLIANNYINTVGEGISKGIVLHPTASGTRVVFNSVNVTGIDLVNGRALEVIGGTNYTIKNNIFANNGGGVAAYFSTVPAVKDIDYNNYFSTGSLFATLGSQSFDNLSRWGTAISGDANSKNLNPKFKSDTALLPFQKQLNGAGIASSNILLDIDGELRNQQAPDIGAQEFMVDFGITRLLSPTNVCKQDANTPITVYLRQFGDIPFIDLKLAYQINDGPIFRDTIPGSISNDLEFTFSQTQDLSLNGIYQFKLWLVENGDDNRFNDTLIVTRKNKDAPVIDFNYVSQCAGINVPFVATASIPTGFIDRVEWDFGDSTIGIGLSTSHHYDTAGRYLVAVKAYSDEGCYTEIKKLITLQPTPVASFTASDICYGNALKPKNTSFMMGDGTIASYLWKWGDGNLSNVFEPVHQYATSDTFNVTLIATSINGCVDSITKPVVTYPLENSSFRLAKTLQDFICEGTSLKLSASGAFSYQWYLDNNPIAGAKDSVYQAIKAGTYSVVFFNQLGCESNPTGNIKLSVNPKPTAEFSYEDYCLGLPTKFTDMSKVDPLNKIKYLWNFGDGSPNSQLASPIYTYTQSNEYKVTLVVQSMLCPNQSDTAVKLIQPETPRLGKKYEPVSVVDGKSKKLEARDFGVQYQWIPSTYLDNPTLREPKYTAGKEQKYTIRITSKAGCITVDTLQVLFFDKCNLLVPGGFSPNYDGKNDRLFPFQIGIKRMVMFRIYDRYGNLVFDNKNATSATGWDGTYNGKKLPVGSYVWIAEAVGDDDVVIRRTGNVMLVR